MRCDWNEEYQREVVALRTVLAYPEGTTPYLQNRQVLDDVIDAYPSVWRFAVDSERALYETTRLCNLFRREAALHERLPLRLFRVFVRLGRREISERQSFDEIERSLRSGSSWRL